MRTLTILAVIAMTTSAFSADITGDNVTTDLTVQGSVTSTSTAFRNLFVDQSDTGPSRMRLGNTEGFVDFVGDNGSLFMNANKDLVLIMQAGRLFFKNGSNTNLFMAQNGRIGIGNAAPASKLHVTGDIQTTSGSVTVDGTTTTDVLTIAGGSDLSEQFNIKSSGDVIPGMVVSIDPKVAGELAVSTTPYDKKVAGIVSGAGGLNVGMMMGQKGSIADGKYPVALTGRVYCYADASNGAIAPGDMLTTSTVPGHAMKVTDAARAHGSIIGKAMTPLDSGSGLVLVLVNLH